MNGPSKAALIARDEGHRLHLREKRQRLALTQDAHSQQAEWDTDRACICPYDCIECGEAMHALDPETAALPSRTSD